MPDTGRWTHCVDYMPDEVARDFGWGDIDPQTFFRAMHQYETFVIPRAAFRDENDGGVTDAFIDWLEFTCVPMTQDMAHDGGDTDVYMYVGGINNIAGFVQRYYYRSI